MTFGLVHGLPIIRGEVQRLNYKLRVEIGGVSVRVNSWFVGGIHLSLPKLKPKKSRIENDTRITRIFADYPSSIFFLLQHVQ